MIDVLPGPGYDPAAYRVEPMTLNRRSTTATGSTWAGEC